MESPKAAKEMLLLWCHPHPLPVTQLSLLRAIDSPDPCLTDPSVIQVAAQYLLHDESSLATPLVSLSHFF